MSKMMDELGLTELRIENTFLFGIWRKEIHLSRAATVAAVAPALTPTPKQNSAMAENPKDPDAPAANDAIRSPMVGVAYLAPEPGGKPFIELGGKVKAGDTLCLIEAMKTFNPVKAERAGIVKEILVREGQAVEYDTPLIVIE